METVKKGSKGEAVKRLQGYLSLIQDGIFGRNTEEVLKAWQKKNGLVADGICGSRTWDRLEAMYGREYKQGEAIPMDNDGKYILKKTYRKINNIILHCTATREGKDYTVAEIRKWHLNIGWSDIAYHYVIYRDGSVRVGRAIDKVGAHTYNHNTGAIGIVYVGGCPSDTVSRGKDTRTSQQKWALYKLVRELMGLYSLNKTQVHGHYEYANKSCPSFDMDEFRRNLNLD